MALCLILVMSLNAFLKLLGVGLVLVASHSSADSVALHAPAGGLGLAVDSPYDMPLLAQVDPELILLDSFETCLCDDGLSCTLDVCDGSQQCVAILQPDHCLIDGLCLGASQPNPENDCETCDSSANPTSWTSLPGDTPCDDGDACTIGSVCVFGVCTDGIPKNCNDDNFCTIDSCDAATGDCLNQPDTGAPCSDNDACTISDQCSAFGVCSGFPKNCNDGNQCTDDTCDPFTGTCLNIPDDTNPCSDGDPDTLNDRCESGFCVGDPT